MPGAHLPLVAVNQEVPWEEARHQWPLPLGTDPTGPQMAGWARRHRSEGNTAQWLDGAQEEPQQWAPPMEDFPLAVLGPIEREDIE